MKKILLGTTTLIGAAALFAGAALADTPKVTLGGYINFEAGFTHDDEDTTQSGHAGVAERPDAFRNDTQVDIKVDGKSDAGLGYGGEVDLLADTTADAQGRGFNASKTFVYLDGAKWGRVELGSNVGADGAMKVDAATIAHATGGINGDWNYFANSSTQFLAQAALPLAYGTMGSGNDNFTGDHTEENLIKATYYTPRFAGFQAGVSFVPDQTNSGQGGTFFGSSVGAPQAQGPDRSKYNSGLASNIWTGGVSYDNKFGDVSLAAAATGEWGNSQDSNYDDLKAYNAGAKLGFMGFSVAGSYGNWGKSETLKADNSKDTHYWTLGGAYEYGPFGASLTWLNSDFSCGAATASLGNTSDCAAAGKDKFNNVSLGADYKLAPGLTPYAEISWYDQNASTSANDNKGYVGILGTQLNF